jgi:hypothetical protein
MLLGGVAALTESLWYTPVVRAVPALGLFLPQPSNYTRPVPTAAHGIMGDAQADQGVLSTSQSASPAPRTLPSASSPTPEPMGSTGIGWSIYDCAFAVDTLEEDAHLDGRAEADGLSPAADPYYYARTAQGWATAASDAAAQCRSAAPVLTGSACTAPPPAFALAMTSHIGDAILRPENVAWDAMWEASYRRLEALWAAVGCPGDK